jgi:hypothetical protein
VYRTPDQELSFARRELEEAEAELAELQAQLKAFESQVDTRLGSMLDELCELNGETAALDEQLRRIREERLFGNELMSYQDGAPQPGRPTRLDNLPPQGLQFKQSAQDASAAAWPGIILPDVKTLYRRLARRYHPDLARSAADRLQANDMMKEINQAYAAGDLQVLMRLAGMSIPYGVDVNQAATQTLRTSALPTDELEKTKAKLRDTRRQINQLTNLPIVKLSLDVKLARHQGRDLLYELTGELHYKVARKTAERDYLRSQIEANQTKPAE